MFIAAVHLNRGDRESAFALSLADAIDPFRQADKRDRWQDQQALIIATTTFNTAESRAEDPVYTCPVSGRQLSWWGRLDNRSELVSQLASTLGARSSTLPLTDQMLLAAAYDRWGQDCVNHLLGDFSFVVYDKGDRSLFVARDPLGVKPLYYFESSELFVAATTAAVFHHLTPIALEPSEEWMAKFLLNSSMSHTETPWPQVKKLAGGHTISASVESGRVRVTGPSRYFSFLNDQQDARKRSSGWVEQYRDVLEMAVQCRLRTDFPIGVETSGGIDSSTCLGFAARLWDRSVDDLHTYGFIVEKDEPDFIYDTGRMHGISNEHMYVAGNLQQVPKLAERAIQVLGYPEEHGNGTSHDIFYVDCERRSVRTLLSGFGGDEVVSNPGDLLYAELIGQHRYLGLLASIGGPVWQRPARFVRHLVGVRRKPIGSLHRAAVERWHHIGLRRQVLEQYHLEAAYLDRHKFSDGYDSINDWALKERLGNPFVPTRLENCTLMAHARKVEYRWPLLDVRLIQQFLSTPALEKRGPNFGRFLHRRALDGVVPHKVAWKPSKYMGGSLLPEVTPNPSDESRRTGLLGDFLREMHPALDPIVDSGRVLERAKQIALSDATQYVARRELNGLLVLDNWLKTHHR